MRQLLAFMFSGILCFSSCVGEQFKADTLSFLTNTNVISRETAHPRAKALLTEDFYWSPIEESGPFGNDDGSDALYDFLEWRKSNGSESPLRFLDTLIILWNYPKFDWNELDTNMIQDYLKAQGKYKPEKLTREHIEDMRPFYQELAKKQNEVFDEKKFLVQLESSEVSNRHRLLLGQDNAIISIGFGQFASEGRIDPELKRVTLIAIRRELLPILIREWDDDYKQTRINQLKSMLEVVDEM